MKSPINKHKDELLVCSLGKYSQAYKNLEIALDNECKDMKPDKAVDKLRVIQLTVTAKSKSLNNLQNFSSLGISLLAFLLSIIFGAITVFSFDISNDNFLRLFLVGILLIFILIAGYFTLFAFDKNGKNESLRIKYEHIIDICKKLELKYKEHITP
ncbi:MAG: hypothetical protein FWD90_13540 [Defluviitaleaceae bacterium]|nr:hypothetical protein [Defluviitaleaceae bacterium]